MSNSSLTPEQVKAARALVAWSQAELAAEARVASSTIADFERGVRSPVANNAHAIREALERKGLKFIAGGVVEKAMLPPAPPPPRPGMLMRWVNATHLSQWGERRDGQSGMPELLRRLIYATAGPAASVRFPSDESVQYPGWDGVCTIAAATSEFVPGGESVWEIGAQRTSIRAKADKDFAKRSGSPLGRDTRKTAFVFVTPQRFVGKHEWVEEKKALGLWADVAAIDGDDLVHWLETCPAVAQWLSVKIGRRPLGLRNMEEVWFEWARATKTPLTPDVVLTGRDDDQIAVLKWLRSAPQLMPIQAEAPDEAMAFLYAAISPLPDPYRLAYWSRCVAADTPDAARQLIGLGTPLIIALTDPDGGLAQRLVDDGHHVFAAYGPGAKDGGGRRLLRPWKHDLQMALVSAGVSAEDAHRFANAAGRSITVLRRLMPAAPNHRATWAKPAPPELFAAMFAGAWVENSGCDRKVISDLAGRPYDDVEAALAPLAELGGPLARVGEVWKVVSLRDLWTQIGGQVTTSQLTRFESAFQTVLGEINPRYVHRPKNNYYERRGEFGEEASAMLRRGLTEALIAMAVYPDSAPVGANVADRVNRAISNLLDGASAALWWSLSGDFHNIAEAAPKSFLDALELGLHGSDPAAMSLFRSDEGLTLPTEYLANLLWSLETLARSPQYLTQSARLLARLDEIDPGGRWGNRPFGSLRRIFVTWSPQTYATATQRLKVIDCIVQDYPVVGWRLLLALAPRPHDTSEPSSMPNWRDFTPDEPEVITSQSINAAGSAIGKRLLEHAGDSGERWRELLDLWASFGSAWRNSAVKQLEIFTSNLDDPNEAEALREKLRALLQRHRGFKDAQWAISEKDLKPLDKIFRAMEPTCLEDQVRWIFRPGAIELGPNLNWNKQHAELEARQTEVAGRLLAELSPDQIFVFASTITMHHSLGVAIARASTASDTKHMLMVRAILADESTEVEVGMGILVGLKLQAGYNGDAWVRSLWVTAINEGWGERAETRIVSHLPPNASTWSEIERRSDGLTEAYWSELSVYSIPKDAEPNYVVDRLLSVGRSGEAVEWLGHNIHTKPDGALLVRTLQAAAMSKVQVTGNDATMLSHWVGTILAYLDTDVKVAEQEVVRIEWTYFQALRYSQRPPRKLHRALARDPEFFVHLLKLIFLPSEDSGVVELKPEDEETTRNLASQAYDVLHDWVHVPGSDDQGIIDPEALEAWVKRARKMLADAGRGEIGDSRIGGILSAAQRQPDESWPPEPVRDIIEVTRSRHLERGFEIGVYNRRGVTVRLPRDGGGQERALAERYRRDAEALRFDWPRTAACLDRIAATYNVDAEREDLSAEQRDWL